jgi:hypothetical protein
MGIRQLKAEIKKKEAAIELNKNLSQLAYSQLKNNVEKKMSLPLLGLSFALGFFGVAKILHKKPMPASKKNISNTSSAEPVSADKQKYAVPLAAGLDLVKVLVPLLALFIKHKD